MFKLIAAVLVLCVLYADAKPAVLAAAPLVAAAPAGVVTATSSQYVARNFNGVAAAPIVATAAYTAAPVAAAAYTAPVVSAAYTSPVAPVVSAAYTAPYSAYSAYSAYPYAAYPYAAGYSTFL